MSDTGVSTRLPPKEIRSQLQAYDQVVGSANENEDSVISEFKYTALPQSKKRIRLLCLRGGSLYSPQIDCSLVEAEFLDTDPQTPNGRYKLVKINNVTATAAAETGTIGTGPSAHHSEQATQANGILPVTRAARATGGADPSTHHSEGASQSNRTLSAATPAAAHAEGEEETIVYEALSWRWGDEEHGQYVIMIHENGICYHKRVSQTLGLALKYLRRTQERYLWIDALCINQSDPDERSIQVSMMSLVYTQATQVCVWLGDDDEKSTMAFRFIRDDIMGLKNFDRLCTDKQHAGKWRALLDLMQRPWFSRRWVVQEIVLAKDATVYCGPDVIPWRELAIAVELFVEVETATHRLSELMKKDDKFELIPKLFEHISELGASILVNATAKVFREPKFADILGDILEAKSPQRKEILSQKSLLSLEYLVTTLSIFDCGRPHDIVYSLIAVARDARPLAKSAKHVTLLEKQNAQILEKCTPFLQQKPYVLDYSRPYADVCKDFVEFCIHRCATNDKTQALNILCRPWAKDWRPDDKHNKFDDEKTDSTKVVKKPNQRRRPRHDDIWKLRVDEKTNEIVKSLAEAVNKSSEPGKPKITGGDKEGEKYSWDDARTMADYFATPLDSSELAGRKRFLEWFPKKSNSEPQDSQNAGTRNRDQTKTHRSREHSLALPSWVVRITAAPFDIFPHPGMDMVKMGRKNADPLAGVPQDAYRNYSAGQTKKVDLKTLKFRRRPELGHYSLYVKGFWFDTVQEVAQVSQGGAIPGTWLDLAGWKTEGSHADIGDPPDAFWRTLVADRGAHDRNPPYYYARACKETIVKGGLRSGAVDTTALIYNERNSIVAEFCRRVQAVIWNRALIKTEKGYLGLVSAKVKPGDKICIIYGCTVPIILRKKPLKTPTEFTQEQFQDCKEIMKRLVPEMEKAWIRKVEWEKKKAQWEEEKKEIERNESKRNEARSNQREPNQEDSNHEESTQNEPTQEEQYQEERKERNQEDLEYLDEIIDYQKDYNDRTRELEKIKKDEEERRYQQNKKEEARKRKRDAKNSEKARKENIKKKIEADEKKKKESKEEKQKREEVEKVKRDNQTQREEREIRAKNASADQRMSILGNRGRFHHGRNSDNESDDAVSEDEGSRGKSYDDLDPEYSGDDYYKPFTNHIASSEPQQDHDRASSKEGSRSKDRQRRDTVAKRKDKQVSANLRDPYRWYEFLGEAYVHGMMDGEAVRQNFYQGRPEHVFEIR